MIVSYDEHEVNNTFKFGVIYQKFRQVSCPHAAFMEYVHQGSTFHEHRLNSGLNSAMCSSSWHWMSSLTVFLIARMFSPLIKK